jgi:outer membrane protein OmpA-like peptidoglycan-associated protein
VVHAVLAGNYQGGIGTEPVPRDLEVDTAPPVVSYGMEPKVIYTDTQGAVQIPATIRLDARDFHGIGAWKLEIKNSQGVVVKAFHGEGKPPESLTWDGLDSGGHYIQSGQTYVSEFSARDTVGNWSAAPPQSQVVLLREIHLNVAADTEFEPGRAELNPANYDQLKAIAASITQYWKPGTVIEVIGHTDSIPVGGGRYASNQELSEARAQAVVAALKTYLGPQASWLLSSGKGDTQPVADNATPEGRARNRRVDIIVKTQNNK